MNNIKKLISSITCLGVLFFTSLSFAENAVSITGDGTDDVVKMQTTAQTSNESSITGDANVTGYYFTQKNSNVRSGAGTSYNVIATLSKGSEVHVQGMIGQWYKIGVEYGEVGYIYATLLDKNSPK